MINQRWRERRESYRPAEPIATHLHEVAALDELSAKTFVTTHHYSGTYPAARFRFGLYERGELVGVAVFSHPCNDAVLTGVFPIPATHAVELGRFVLLDRVAGNGESWFVARCFELLRKDVAGIISHADPVARSTADGRVIHPGHVGCIYQATNAVYLGRTKRRTLLVLPDGTVFSERAVQKIRNGERGWKHAAAKLERFGAAPLELGDSRAWLGAWLPQLARPLRHGGNIRYAWAFNRALRRGLVSAGPYPKLRDESQAVAA